jgi:hypothetical protein
MQAVFGYNGQHLLCSSCIVGSECDKCGYGLCYMQQKFETAADHFLTLAAKNTPAGSRNLLVARNIHFTVIVWYQIVGCLYCFTAVSYIFMHIIHTVIERGVF